MMRSYEHQPSGTVAELRRLRREAPEPERRLLRAPRESYPKLKWRHQSPVGPYKPDILCFSERLVVEVDGDTHTSTADEDTHRSRFLARQGYRVIRFTNADVMSNLDGVIAQLSLSLREREGAPKAREGEGDPALSSPSTSHSAAPSGPLPLPNGEER
jgi:very-short-patch-repair endonuclease